MVIDATDVFPGVTEVGQMFPLRMEAVLVSRPGDSVGDTLPLVRVGAAPHIVARFWDVARVGDAVLLSLNAIGGFVPDKTRIKLTTCISATLDRKLHLQEIQNMNFISPFSGRFLVVSAKGTVCDPLRFRDKTMFFPRIQITIYSKEHDRYCQTDEFP